MQRIESIDILRGFAIILVVLGHVVEKNGLPEGVLFNWIYSFHMPLFMCLSGFVTCYSYSLRKEFGREHLYYIGRKFRAIMFPYITWGLLVRPLFFNELNAKLDYVVILKSMFVTNTSYWFLPCLFGLIILFSFYKGIQRICRIKNDLLDIGLLAFLSLCVAGIYVGTHSDFFRSVLSYILPFFIGVYAAQSLKFRAFLFSNVSVYTVALLIFCLIDGWFGSSVGLLNKGVRLLTGILALPICFYFVQHFSFSDRIKRQLIRIGQNTLVIYIMHYYFLYISNLSCMREMNIAIQLVVFGLYSLLIVYICVFLSKFFEKSPVLRLFALGKK